jgi:cyclophilin family peptidyl-prolyl cis-trans isomerase
MKRGLIYLLALAAIIAPVRAGTLATIQTSIGPIELELFDDDKPITVTNFIRYIQSGRYENTFIQRWATNFVIQAGGYFVTNGANGSVIDSVPTFGNIQNEYSSGTIYSNVYGTIAMARRGGVVNSASSQWFINLNSSNTFLDKVDEGFTVFGRVISGTNVLNRFLSVAQSDGISLVNIGAPLDTLPVLKNPPSYNDLIYLDYSLRRDVALKVAQGRTGKTITWNSVSKYNNVVEYAAGFPLQWQVLTNVPGTGGPISISDPSISQSRVYRVKLLLP